MKKRFQLFKTPVYTGGDALFNLELHLRKHFYNESKIILVDENTSVKCLPRLIQQCKSLNDAFIIEIKSGEQNKTLECAQHIWQQLNENFIDRNAVLINLGGGVLTDIGAFCGSTYKRGIKFINVPTTLLGMVDAAIGGKTAVDFNHYKNVIGTWSQPEAVVMWNSFLETLDSRNIKCGYAEMIKHALIADAKLWKKFSKAPFDECITEESILSAAKIKSRIVKKDPHEKSLRKVLNFGHTAGHAIESYSIAHDASPLMHGECVAAGMVIESYLSYKISSLKKDDVKNIAEHIDAIYRLKKFDAKAVTEIIKLMKYDKKNNKSKINFTLLQSIGKASVDHYCENKFIKEAFTFYNSIAE